MEQKELRQGQSRPFSSSESVQYGSVLYPSSFNERPAPLSARSTNMARASEVLMVSIVFGMLVLSKNRVKFAEVSEKDKKKF